LRRNSPGSWPRLSSMCLPDFIPHLPCGRRRRPWVGAGASRSFYLSYLVIDGWQANLNTYEKDLE
jgi:hypothetical protein